MMFLLIEESILGSCLMIGKMWLVFEVFFRIQKIRSHLIVVSDRKKRRKKYKQT